MIKTKMGQIEMRGTGVELLADVAVIATSLGKNDISKEDVIRSVEAGYEHMSEDENGDVGEELAEALSKVMDIIRGKK